MEAMEGQIMKKQAIEYLSDIHSEDHKGAIVAAIELAQKDAYDDAIDNVVTLIDEHEEEVYIGVIEDILGLKYTTSVERLRSEYTEVVEQLSQLITVPLPDKVATPIIIERFDQLQQRLYNIAIQLSKEQHRQ